MASLRSLAARGTAACVVFTAQVVLAQTPAVPPQTPAVPPQTPATPPPQAPAVPPPQTPAAPPQTPAAPPQTPAAPPPPTLIPQQAPAEATPTGAAPAANGATPVEAAGGRIVQQAGVGSETSYARAGVLELGGSLSFSHAHDFTEFRFGPQAGWFVADNLELSAIASFDYINTGGEGSSYMTLLGEPSLHLPFSPLLFGFVGIGAGLTYADGPGAGLALAPRLGTKMLVGRSGVVTAALQAVYSSSQTVTTAQGATETIGLSYGLNVGFTVMW